ncbi:hypothetical protein ACFXG4_17840 [Nocardia sp. NPDC059246]|uniref:hypothetical protein n=1 Tax=unclassified Nocardia TaxID=2637762 RepID=UPI00368DE6CF
MFDALRDIELSGGVGSEPGEGVEQLIDGATARAAARAARLAEIATNRRQRASTVSASSRKPSRAKCSVTVLADISASNDAVNWVLMAM